MAKNVFVIEDGTKELTIENSFHEEICKIHIRPGDFSIIDRFTAMQNDFKNITAPLEGVELSTDGTAEGTEGWEKVKEVEKNLIDRLNQVFDSKDIGNLFVNRNAFSVIGGEYYAERVMTMLGEVVAAEMEEESKRVKKRLDKYTADLKK